MSRDVAKLVYSRKCGSMARKAVLAYFAERANDDGSDIWASKQRIADEIECTKQTVISTVKSLEADGLIAVTGHRKTQGGYTVIYRIDLTAIAALPETKQSNDLTSQGVKPVKDIDPSSTEAVNQFDRYESEPVKEFDPDQSKSLTQTVLEPSNDVVVTIVPTTSRRPRAVQPEVDIPDWIPVTPWLAYLEMRRKKHAAPTPHAIGLLITKIERLRDGGHDPGAVLDQSTLNNWTDIYPIKEQKNEQARHSFDHPRSGRSADGAARALDRQLGLGEFAGEAGRCDPGEGSGYIPLAIAGPGAR